MKKINLYITVISVVILSYSCVKTSESEKVAEKFYTFLSEDQFKSPIDYLSELAIDAHTKKEWASVFEDRNKYWGKPEKWELSSSEMTSTKIGEVVELRYKVKNEEGTTYEILRFIEEGGDMKILYYFYSDNSDYKSSDESEEDEDTEGNLDLSAQFKVIDEFYDMYKAGDFSGLEDIISKTALEYSGLEEWNDILTEKLEYFGEMRRARRLSSETVGAGDDAFYLIIYEVTYDDQSVSYEKFQFSVNDEPKKIAFYRYNTDFDEL
jgi:hypothetical protein